jgi:hypothetical protein
LLRVVPRQLLQVQHRYGSFPRPLPRGHFRSFPILAPRRQWLVSVVVWGRFDGAHRH